MRKVTIILALFVSINSTAQTPRPARNSSHRAKAWAAAAVNVDAVLDKYVKAIGGRARIEKISSRVSKGTFELESLAGVKGSVEIYQKAPNKQVGIINIPGIGTDAAGFDGTIAWEVEPDSGVVHEKSGSELASARREAEFYGDIKFRELFPSMTLRGVVKIGGESAYVIEAVPAEGSAERFYFDTVTGLLIRHDSTEEGADGKRSIEEYFADYRLIDGVRLPFMLRQVSPGMNIRIRLTEIKQNVAVDDSKFHKPEEQ